MEHSEQIPRRKEHSRGDHRPSERPKQSSEIQEHSGGSIVESAGGIDRNTMILIGVLGVSIGFSIFLYREITKLRSSINDSLVQQKNNNSSGLIEKVDENSQSVQIIEQKIDQLIMSLRIPIQQATKAAHIQRPPAHQVQQVQPQQVQPQPQQVKSQQVQVEKFEEYSDSESEEESEESDLDGDEGVCFPPKKKEVQIVI